MQAKASPTRLRVRIPGSVGSVCPTHYPFRNHSCICIRFSHQPTSIVTSQWLRDLSVYADIADEGVVRCIKSSFTVRSDFSGDGIQAVQGGGGCTLSRFLRSSLCVLTIPHTTLDSVNVSRLKYHGSI